MLCVFFYAECAEGQRAQRKVWSGLVSCGVRSEIMVCFYVVFFFYAECAEGQRAQRIVRCGFFSCGVRSEMYGVFFIVSVFLRRVRRGAEVAEKCMVWFCFMRCKK